MRPYDHFLDAANRALRSGDSATFKYWLGRAMQMGYSPYAEAERMVGQPIFMGKLIKCADGVYRVEGEK